MSATINVESDQGKSVHVSVVIPAYNAEQTLGPCLGSLARQSYASEHYEVIVVDDGSTDQTAGIARRFPVRYFFQDNQGPATARNKGGELARGEILLFTDSDCVPHRDWVKEMVAAFDDPEVMAVKGAYRTEQKGIVARFAQLEFEERFTMLEKVTSIDMVDTYSAGYRREVFIRLGGFDTRFPVANNEDVELSYRMAAQNYRMVFNPGAIVYHLGHPDTVGRYARLKFSRGYWRMVVYKQFPGKMLKDSYTPQSLKMQILVLFLLVLALPAPLLFPGWGPLLLAGTVALFIILIFPFSVTALKKDPAAGLATPFLLAVRGASLGLGVVWGLLFGRI